MRGELESERLYLTLAHPALAGAVADYFRRNRDFLAPFDPLREESFFTPRGQRRLLRREAALARAGEGWTFYLRRKDAPERIIGRVVLSNAVWGSFCSCYLGYKLDREELHRGYMTEAVAAVVDWGFELGLHRIEASVMPRNAPSLGVLERCGFQREGLSPGYLEINGVWEDHIHLAKLNPHWQEKA